MRRWIRAALSLALVASAACESGPEDETTNAPSPRPTPAASPTPSPTPSSSPSPEIVPQPFSAARAKGHVEVLAGDIGVRRTGTPGYRQAAEYVRARFEEAGYRVRLAPFETAGGVRSWNVVASWPGSRPRILLGAHLDTVPGSPGANDNASGVAVLLELARSVAGTQEALRLRFVAFGGEEVQTDGGHHYGSSAYVAEMRRKPRMMVSVDMVGKPRTVFVGWMGTGPGRTVEALWAAANAAKVPAVTRVFGDNSDNGPFEKAGVAAALLWTGPEPNYHSPGDVVSNASRRALGRIGRLLSSFILFHAP